MRRVAPFGLALTLLLAAVPPAGAQRAPAVPQPPAAHGGELNCLDCHRGKHHGVLQMYLGVGGRGTPMIPSHMFQVRVQCVACHVRPKEAARPAEIVGQTFRPSEQACIGCHGEAYRGMLARWVETLARMRAVVLPKLEAARAALPGADPAGGKATRARQLVGDAGHNLEFVALAKGVHNVFYAADLLKLANGWLDEALAILSTAAPRADDALVRGGYCGVLCHEQAGVKQSATVVFAKQKVPHVRHVTEFGAVCTSCHSADVHKAVTATPATCSGCHHSPGNERCESCHRAQSAFYRGALETAMVPAEANVMANVVACTGCHDLSQKHSREAVGKTCLACHDEAYAAFVEAWTTGLDESAASASGAIKRAEAALARARRAGRALPEAESLLADARAALATVRKARGVHNPSVAETLLDAARHKAEQALAGSGAR